ncbi:PREDICTED: uncharacterized protein LOC105503238 [Colobus angolensis palliatus]|uniref:uncharacterized protein LOC105503238 n=1 Tax=Colobus angolensis palliatus TaxID=336983 RepID=UPI0005F58AA0|nr:PREDICTED: uncharacterized protein LOC105503238 [Colobus angolensis palliatus]
MSGRAELTPSCPEAEGSRLFLHMNAEPGLSPLYMPARPPRQGKNELSVPIWLSVRSRAGQARVRASRGCCGCQGPGRKVRGSASTAGPPSSGVKAALGDLPEALPATVARPPSAQTYRLKDARPSPSWSAPHLCAARSALWETECSAGRAPRLPRLQNYNSHKALGRNSRRLSGRVALAHAPAPLPYAPALGSGSEAAPETTAFVGEPRPELTKKNRKRRDQACNSQNARRLTDSWAGFPWSQRHLPEAARTAAAPGGKCIISYGERMSFPALPVMTGSGNCRSSWASSMQRGGAPRDPTVPLRPDAEAVPARDEDAGSWPLGHG